MGRGTWAQSPGLPCTHLWQAPPVGEGAVQLATSKLGYSREKNAPKNTMRRQGGAGGGVGVSGKPAQGPPCSKSTQLVAR